MIIARELYAINISSAAWRENLTESLKSLGYKSFKTDADVWMKRDFNINRYPYYNYILCYVDDLLNIGFNPKEDMDALNLIYLLN